MASDKPSLTEKVQERGMTQEDLMETQFVGPEDDGTTEVLLDPELEEQGGEIVHRHGAKHLVWEYEGATIDLSNGGFGQWRAEVAVPEDVAQWLHGPGGVGHKVKSTFTVGLGGHKEGYVDEVWVDNEATRGVLGENVPPTRLVVRTMTNYQPTVQLESFVDDLWEHAEASEESAADAERAFKAAKENEP